MKAKARRRAPEIVLREGKPAAVILDIEEYQEMLERLEDAEDLRMLKEMRKKTLRFKSLKSSFKGKGTLPHTEEDSWERIRSLIYEGRGG